MTIPSVTDELLREIEQAALAAAHGVIRSHGWEGTVDEFADEMLGSDERYMRAANPSTVLALIAHIRELEAREVVLPCDRSLSASDDPWYVRNICKDAIEAAGIKVKP